MANWPRRSRDRWNVHRCAVEYFDTHHPDWFTFEQLPAYAPELNPVEQCWNHTKYADLENFIPDDVDHLQQAIQASITEQSEERELLKSFFAYARLLLLS